MTFECAFFQPLRATRASDYHAVLLRSMLHLFRFFVKPPCEAFYGGGITTFGKNNFLIPHGVLSGRQFKDDDYLVCNLWCTLLGTMRAYTCEMCVASVVSIQLSPLHSALYLGGGQSPRKVRVNLYRRTPRGKIALAPTRNKIPVLSEVRSHSP